MLIKLDITLKHSLIKINTASRLTKFQTLQAQLTELATYLTILTIIGDFTAVSQLTDTNSKILPTRKKISRCLKLVVIKNLI